MPQEEYTRYEVGLRIVSRVDHQPKTKVIAEISRTVSAQTKDMAMGMAVDQVEGNYSGPIEVWIADIKELA